MKNFSTIPVLDGFRSFSILLVLIGHYFEFCHSPRIDNYFAGLGVLLFFILSGFLITKTLLDEEQQNGKVNFQGFYLRRARRILPAFLFFLCVLAALKLGGWISDVPAYDFLANLLFVRNWIGRGLSDAHLWTLSLEVQFYLFWPYTLMRCREKNRGWLTLGLFLAFLVWRVIAIQQMIYPLGSGKFYMRTDFRMDSLLGGSLIAILYSRSQFRERLFQFQLGGGITLGLGLSILAWTGWAYGVPEVQSYFLSVMEILAMSFLVLLLFLRNDRVSQGLSSKPFRWISELSYSLYLWQQLFFVNPTDLEPAFYRQLPTSLFLLLLCASFSYFGIEKFGIIRFLLRRSVGSSAGGGGQKR